MWGEVKTFIPSPRDGCQNLKQRVLQLRLPWTEAAAVLGERGQNGQHQLTKKSEHPRNYP